MVTRDDDALRDQLVGLIPRGRDNAISAKWLAAELGTSTRVIGALVADLIEVDGYAIGSRCDADPGYFQIRDEEDARVGVAHTVARGRAIFRRVRALQRNTEAVLREPQPQLFSLDALEEAG